jgi:hypothetical protein
MQLLDSDPGAWKTAEAPTATATDISVGTVTCTKILNDDLTSGRVVIATTSGEMTDNSGFLFDGSYLTVPSLKNTAGTATRVPYYGSSKELADEAAFAYTAGTNTLAVGVVSGTIKHTCTDLSVNGAITVASGINYITKAGVCALTLADPSSQDGVTIMVVATTAHAHTITFNAGKINGGSLTTATFGGAIGDSIVVTAIGTVWYTVGAPRNVTIS